MAITAQLVGKLGGGFKPISGLPLAFTDGNTRTLTTVTKKSVVAIKWDSDSSGQVLIVNGVEYTDRQIFILAPAGSITYKSKQTYRVMNIVAAWIADAPDGL